MGIFNLENIVKFNICQRRKTKAYVEVNIISSTYKGLRGVFHMITNTFLKANEGKNIQIEVDGRSYNRYAIKTHFVEEGENLLEIVERYVVPLYEKNDILSISEKIVALCQGDIIHKQDLRVTPLAKILSRYVYNSPYGYGVKNVYRMQVAINLVGPLKILFAATMAAATKIFGIRGVFYKIVGNGISNIDGFIDEKFEYYKDRGILAPSHPYEACQKVKDKYDIDCMIVDANDLGVEFLGSNIEIADQRNLLRRIIKDNPAGQSRQQTPLILIRPQQQQQKQKVSIA